MSEAATRKDIDEVLTVLDTFIARVDERFVNIEARLDELDKKFSKLLESVDKLVSRIDKYETELAARDNQFEKLLVWARKVSEKTGIPLENL